jgi:hypothetical protein
LDYKENKAAEATAEIMAVSYRQSALDGRPGLTYPPISQVNTSETTKAGAP